MLHLGSESNVISIFCVSCTYCSIDNKADFDFDFDSMYFDADTCILLLKSFNASFTDSRVCVHCSVAPLTRITDLKTFSTTAYTARASPFCTCVLSDPLLPLELCYACALVVACVSSSPSQKLFILCGTPSCGGRWTNVWPLSRARTPRDTLPHSRTEPPADPAEPPDHNPGE